MPKRRINCYRPKDLRYGLTFVICYEIAVGIEIAGTNFSYRFSHVTSPNSRIQNREAYKIFSFIQGKIT